MNRVSLHTHLYPRACVRVCACTRARVRECIRQCVCLHAFEWVYVYVYTEYVCVRVLFSTCLHVFVRGCGLGRISVCDRAMGRR